MAKVNFTELAFIYTHAVISTKRGAQKSVGYAQGEAHALEMKSQLEALGCKVEIIERPLDIVLA